MGAGSSLGTCLGAAEQSLSPSRHFLPAGLWTFLWFIGFCFLTNQWAWTPAGDVHIGADSARAAITFSFFSVFSWVSEAVAELRGERGGAPWGRAALTPQPLVSPGPPDHLCLQEVQDGGGGLCSQLRGPQPGGSDSLLQLPQHQPRQLPAAALHPHGRRPGGLSAAASVLSPCPAARRGRLYQCNSLRWGGRGGTCDSEGEGGAGGWQLLRVKPPGLSAGAQEGPGPSGGPPLAAAGTGSLVCGG